MSSTNLRVDLDLILDARTGLNKSHFYAFFECDFSVQKKTN